MRHRLGLGGVVALGVHRQRSPRRRRTPRGRASRGRATGTRSRTIADDARSTPIVSSTVQESTRTSSRAPAETSICARAGRSREQLARWRCPPRRGTARALPTSRSRLPARRRRERGRHATTLADRGLAGRAATDVAARPPCGRRAARAARRPNASTQNGGAAALAAASVGPTASRDRDLDARRRAGTTPRRGSPRRWAARRGAARRARRGARRRRGRRGSRSAIARRASAMRRGRACPTASRRRARPWPGRGARVVAAWDWNRPRPTSRREAVGRSPSQYPSSRSSAHLARGLEVRRRRRRARSSATCASISHARSAHVASGASRPERRRHVPSCRCVTAQRGDEVERLVAVAGLAQSPRGLCEERPRASRSTRGAPCRRRRARPVGPGGEQRFAGGLVLLGADEVRAGREPRDARAVDGRPPRAASSARSWRSASAPSPAPSSARADARRGQHDVGALDAPGVGVDAPRRSRRRRAS